MGGEVGIVQPLKTMLDVSTTEDIFATVGYIKEAILLDVVVEYLSDRCWCGRENIINEYEDGLFRWEIYSFSDDIDELSYSQVVRDDVFCLINGLYVTVRVLLDDDGEPIWVFLSNAGGLEKALV